MIDFIINICNTVLLAMNKYKIKFVSCFGNRQHILKKYYSENYFQWFADTVHIFIDKIIFYTPLFITIYLVQTQKYAAHMPTLPKPPTLGWLFKIDTKL